MAQYKYLQLKRKTTSSVQYALLPALLWEKVVKTTLSTRVYEVDELSNGPSWLNTDKVNLVK